MRSLRSGRICREGMNFFNSFISFSHLTRFLLINIIWVQIFKNGSSKIFQRLSSTNITWSILEYFVPFIVPADLWTYCLPFKNHKWFRLLTYFQPIIYFYTPSKHQKTSGFVMFSGGIEVKHWLKWVDWMKWFR